MKLERKVEVDLRVLQFFVFSNEELFIVFKLDDYSSIFKCYDGDFSECGGQREIGLLRGLCNGVGKIMKVQVKYIGMEMRGRI